MYTYTPFAGAAPSGTPPARRNARIINCPGSVCRVFFLFIHFYVTRENKKKKKTRTVRSGRPVGIRRTYAIQYGYAYIII